MDVSDDEDPLALLPRTRSRNRARSGQPRRSETEPTQVNAPVAEVVPTSDSEEAHEDSILTKGWEEYLTSTSRPAGKYGRARLLEPDVSSENSTVVATVLPSISPPRSPDYASEFDTSRPDATREPINFMEVDLPGSAPVEVEHPHEAITEMFPTSFEMRNEEAGPNMPGEPLIRMAGSSLKPDGSQDGEVTSSSVQQGIIGPTSPVGNHEPSSLRSISSNGATVVHVATDTSVDAGQLEIDIRSSTPVDVSKPQANTDHSLTPTEVHELQADASDQIMAAVNDLNPDLGQTQIGGMEATGAGQAEAVNGVSSAIVQAEPQAHSSQEAMDVVNSFGHSGFDLSQVTEAHDHMTAAADAVDNRGLNQSQADRTTVGGELDADDKLDSVVSDGADRVAGSSPMSPNVPAGRDISHVVDSNIRLASSPVRPAGSLPRARTRSPSLTPPGSTSPVRRLSPRPAGFVPAPESMIQEEPEIDPALLAFQNARTFRRRTAIQLQPYTREKTKYRAMVRTGGRLLIAELLHDDPDRAAIAAGLKDAADSQFRGEEEVSDEAEIDMAVSPPVSPIDQDYADHFEMYGEVADDATDSRLQAIAKTRLKRDRQESRRRARADKEAQQYMAFLEKEIKERERKARVEEKKEKQRLREEKTRQKEELARTRAEAQTVRTGRPVPKQRAEKRPAVRQGSSDPEEDPQPNSKRRKLVRRAPSSETETIGRSNSAAERRDHNTISPLTELHNLDNVGDNVDAPINRGLDGDDYAGAFDDGGFPAVDDEMPGLTLDSAFSSRPPLSPSRTIDLATPISISGTSEGSNSDAEADGPREKVKALKRVMPALLAKRLADKAETDYQARQRRKAAKAKEAEDARRIRPGQAVRRTAKGPTAGQGVEGLFDDDPMLTGDDDIPHFALERPPDPMINIFSSSEDEVAAVEESDSGLSSNGSQYRHERLRQFQDGDFASLLHGPRVVRRNTAVAQRKSTSLFKRSRAGVKPKGAVKSRLPPQKDRGSKGLGRSSGAPVKKPRPRKQILDDQTIFEWEPGSAVKSRTRPPSSRGEPQAEKRVFARTPSALARPLQVARGSASPARSGSGLASEIGALSPLRKPAAVNDVSDMWDELQDFQIDFAIKPLQSGVEFSATSFIGAGKLRNYLDYLENASGLLSAAGTEALGLVFEPSMEIPAFIAILPITFDKIRDEVLEVICGRADPSTSSALDAVSFLISYLANSNWNDEEVRQVQTSLQSLDGQLKELLVPRATRDRSRAFFLLESKLLLTIALMVLSQADKRLDSPTAYDYDVRICQQLSGILEDLLRYGFDRTIKPLKAVMAFQAENGMIDDFSAECWVAVLHLTTYWDTKLCCRARDASTMQHCLDQALDRAFDGRHVGPRASERIWYLALGLAALSQFDRTGKVPSDLSIPTRWHLVRKALNAVKISSHPEEEEMKKRHQLKPRDKYIKIMVIRCLQLTSVWRWHCDRESFSIATKDLGVVFRERNLRGLPNESYADFPVFIRRFNRSLAEEIDMEESAYNLYLQLVCLCASDIVTTPPDLNEAKQAANDVKRLMLSIVPFSPVRIREGKIPSDRQLSALVNRFSTAIIAAIFDISLLPFLLGNTRKWIDFTSADIESRRTCIRGLMYLGVAARHHGESLSGVVKELSAHFETIQMAKSRLEASNGSENSILEHGRLLVLIVGCFKTLITTQSYDGDAEVQPKFPDPELLAPCWTQRLRSTELVADRRAGLEVVACVQSYLDARAAALPARSRAKRPLADAINEESQQSDYSAMGLDFTDADLLAIDGAAETVAPEALLDAKVAQIVADSVSPGIYALLSNTMSISWQQRSLDQHQAERQLYISALTRCWAECASVLVVDHHLRDWDTYLAYGQESWERLGDEVGKRQIGMNFMLNVAQLDPLVLSTFAETYVILTLQALVAQSITIEPTFVSTILLDAASQDHFLLRDTWPQDSGPFDRAGYLENRLSILKVLFYNAGTALRSSGTGFSKAFIYRCVNSVLTTMQQNHSLMSLRKTTQRSEYRTFSNDVVRVLQEESGGSISDVSVPKLKQFPLPEPVHNLDAVETM